MMPSKLITQLKTEVFWNKRCVHSAKCGIQAEHAHFYGKKAIQERWNIVPVAPEFNYNPSTPIKEKSQLYALMQCKGMGEWETTKAKYPKKNWGELYDILSNKYPNFTQKHIKIKNATQNTCKS